MRPSRPVHSLTEDLALARDLAARTGARAIDLARRGRWSGRTLAELGDNAADGFLCGWLAAVRPNDAILSEETTDSRARLTAERVWIVDPIDGSKEYGSGGNEWAVQVALWVRGRLALGALALSGDGPVLAGICGDSDDTLGGEATPVRGTTPEPSRPRIIVSKNHTPKWAPDFAERLGGTIVTASGVGYKVARVLLGAADVYVHEGSIKLYEWDTAAPEAVARAFGWNVSGLDGGELVYNRVPPTTGDFLVCRPASKTRCLEALRASGAI
jgi:3'(2'), 5'-bisphosphate nucleotidase